MIDQASIQSQNALSTTLLDSSMWCGWTSAFVERRRCSERVREFSLDPTPDIHVAMQLTGVLDLETLRHGRWRSETYSAGSLGIAAPSERTTLRSHCSAPCDIAHLFLPAETFARAADLVRPAGRSAARLPELRFDDPAIGSLITRLIAAMRRGLPDLIAEQATAWLAFQLLTIDDDEHDAGRHRPRDLDHRLARAVALITEEPGSALSLDRLAGEAGISKFHFARLFKEKLGLSPYVYVENKRMALACRLLATTDLTISTVAWRAGYATPQQFSVAFRRINGTTPTAYRTRHHHTTGDSSTAQII